MADIFPSHLICMKCALPRAWQEGGLNRDQGESEDCKGPGLEGNTEFADSNTLV